MPLVSYPGQDVADLEAAVASVEKGKAKVTQVVGKMAGRWYLLIESPPTRKAPAKAAAPRETRGKA
jgi:hypothetical protein